MGFKDKKRGFTLIELIIALAIGLIVLGVSYQMLFTAYKNYRLSDEKSIRYDSFDDGLLTIDRVLKGKMIEKIEIFDNESGISNEIKVSYREKHSENRVYQKIIKLDDSKNKIILETYKDDSRSGVNVIMRDVSKFTIIKKDKLYYLIIENLKGEERIQCL
ncbi:MAG: prepilin-type N-terminal cleavage/methylation domain-containing protein [Clostridiales bacterium]|nr:prepilin-type N-terminal cleavage/methylation domain-containing protein [Clostridiales bacterium]